MALPLIVQDLKTLRGKLQVQCHAYDFYQMTIALSLNPQFLPVDSIDRGTKRKGKELSLG
jgi:hypothetical protein